MRQKKAFGRGRVVPILIAAGAGYLIGNWQAAALRSSEPSRTEPAAQTVAALDLPQDLPQGLRTAPAAQPANYERPAAATVMGDAQLALFDPEPMIRHPAAPQAEVQQGPTATAAPEPAPPAPRPASPSLAKAAGQPVGAVKPHPAAPPRVVRRPGYMLDDTQISSIKQRLHLTPDQERMWPAVEAALRNIAATREYEAHAGARGPIDPNSTEVQDLKSAAIPLLMSFSDEQKDEVRNLAHVMGLDQLASEF
jgi:hypothetical protein